jgi:thiosulfate/3-mercaptopyruvate sulfurtransferase
LDGGSVDFYSGAMIKRTLLSVLLGLGFLTATTVRAEILSAPAAEAAMAEGALVWDVRAQASTGLPGALRIDAASLDAWLEGHDLVALRQAVSRAGLDLSRDIVVYGGAGDARAQALVESLQGLSPGRVHWFVGGVSEWTMSGRSLLARSGSRLPVPQWLVAPIADGSRAMASASLRSPPQDLTLRTLR